MSAALLAEATRLGIELRVDADGKLKARMPMENVPFELIAALRCHKAELIELISGRCCRLCGGLIDWSRPGAIVRGDGVGEHLACYEADSLRRTGRGSMS